MILFRAFLLWSMVSVHLVGAAFLFRRLFPRESRWLAFILPELILILFCNFLEHFIPIVSLRFLLPFTTVASIWVMVAPGSPWRVMRLPSLILVGAFAFNLFLRAMLPNINDCRDGVNDLGIICDFLFGQTLPADSSWLPPVKMVHYYYLEHYGASILIRIFGVEPGTGFNLSTALLAAYISFCAGAMGWLLSRGKLWIAILMPVLTACSATGSDGYLWLTVKNLTQEDMINLHSAMSHPEAPHNWLLRKLTPIYLSDQPELLPPGFGGWVGSFHSVQAGQFVVGIAVLSFVELLRRRRSNWPWICFLLSPFLMLTTCTWSLPMLAVLVLAGLAIAFFGKLRPASIGFVLAGAGGLLACLEPMLLDLLNWNPVATIDWVRSDIHTQWPDFLAQWWLVGLPWLTLPFVWKRLSSVTRVLIFLAPVTCIAVDVFSVGWRGDMTAKSWGCLYAACWMVFLPELARQKAWPYRTILALIVVACLLSLCFWTKYDWHNLDTDAFGHLDGRGDFRTDDRKARIVASLSQVDGQVVIPSQTDGDGESALMMPFSHTKAYATWSMLTDIVFYTNSLGEAGRRRVMVSALYAGKLPDPLAFLRQHNIAALVIYPDDNIDPAVVLQLKQKLAPYYTYEDAWDRNDQDLQNDKSPDIPCAGVFVYHPEMATLPAAPNAISVK